MTSPSLSASILTFAPWHSLAPLGLSPVPARVEPWERGNIAAATAATPALAALIAEVYDV